MTAGYGRKHGAKSRNLVDYPGNYHDGAAGISFADGHTEMHRWVDAFAKNLTLTGVAGGPVGRIATSSLPGFGLATASDFSAQVMPYSSSS